MSEHEKREQIGMLAEEVSRIKGELNHITEKLNRAFFAYQRLTQSGSPNNWTTANGQLNIPQGGQFPSQGGVEFDALLNKHQLVEVLEHKQKLTSELNAAMERLRGLAPHLF